ncbi:hypothetical protein MSAN_01874300 [Mycena sanguinolenta]|uniref:Uncharacterized protein n=1 Tax=Mycena sanguinolenta TaxID=230812 RepID=A0A8H6XS28_9AGAR|nr:hypothetical protein MSAN_01874300 [Mycena sanguinolenta]
MSGFVIRIPGFLCHSKKHRGRNGHDLSFDWGCRFPTLTCSAVFNLPQNVLLRSATMTLHIPARYHHQFSTASFGKHVRRVPLARKASKFLRRFSLRKLHIVPRSPSTKPPDGHDDSERTITKEPQSQTAQTAANVLVFSLRTLSGISSNIPMVGGLSGIIDTLLNIVGQVQQTSANEQSLAQLAARIERLTPIVTQMTEDDPLKGQGIVENLQRELASMTQQLKVAKTRGKLDQFFNSADNSSILQLHNEALDQMIADSTFLTVHEVAKSLRELESSKLQQPYPDITGGTGGDGGPGHTGGEGGEGGGPELDMDPDERVQIRKISGGTGGTGGVGVAVGGKGGAGRGPVINLRRIRVLTTPESRVEKEFSIL